MSKGKLFTIPVYWQMYGKILVEADTLEDAIRIAKTDNNIALPSNGSYVEESFGVDEEAVLNYN